MFKKVSLVISLIGFCLIVSLQCCKHPHANDPLPTGSPLEAEQDEEFSGGINFTVNDATSNAFGYASGILTSDELTRFEVGNSFFRSNWVIAPSTTIARDGLGPLFNARSCSGCHNLDGRGLPPLNPGDELSGLLFRLSISGMDPHGGPLEDPSYGGQLNNFAIPNVVKEGTVNVSYVSVTGTYKDGSGYTLRNPVYIFQDLGYGAMQSILFSPRLAPQNPGLGLLEAITESDILAKADPDDTDQDGISGRPNYVWDYTKEQTVIGRFGWKANQPDLFQQTAAAFSGDLGVSTSLFSNQNLSSAQHLLYDTVTTGGNPELSDAILSKVVFYCQMLCVPKRRNWSDATVLRGKELFSQAKCASCHSPYFVTGPHPVSYVSNQKIRPYTDLLLHDMGAGLADNRPDFQATGSEWRTPPLWGLGLIATVSKYRFLMHDGRAQTIEEAILWHGGEGEFSKNAFINMNKTDRDALIAFLESL